MTSAEAQTEQEKGSLASAEMCRLRDDGKGVGGSLGGSEDDPRWKKKKFNVKRGTRGIHENEIDEDDEYDTDNENTGQGVDSRDLSQTDIGNYMSPPVNARGIELSRVSGDLDFTDDDEDANLDQDPEAKRLAE